jgi:peroxiredoxin
MKGHGIMSRTRSRKKKDKIRKRAHGLRKRALSSLEVGNKAPEFELPDQDMVVRSLRDFSGKKIVLVFFPGAFTEVCTREMCAFRDSTKPLMVYGAQLVGVSVNDPFTNKAFVDRNGLPFPVLSDYARRTIRRYGVALENFAGLKDYTVAKRSVFILDEAGKVRYRWVSEDPVKEPDYGEVMKQLSELWVK